MTDKEKIRNIIELFIAWNGETDVIDVANIDSAVEFIASSLQEEPVSEDLEKSAKDFSNNLDNIYGSIGEQTRNAFKAGAKWQKEQMMAKAVDGEVGYWNIRGLSVNMDLPRTLEEDDKVKLIIIKEDKV